jgi:hypothetical protein
MPRALLHAFLCVRDERQYGRQTAEKRDELAPPGALDLARITHV